MAGLLKFEFQIDKSGPKPTVHEAMAFDPVTRDKIWIKFEHNVTGGTFKASAPKYPNLHAEGKDFQECLVNFQKAYDELTNSNRNDNLEKSKP